jgi:RNA polymerase sigma-70 factor (ECF subfamily)
MDKDDHPEVQTSAGFDTNHPCAGPNPALEPIERRELLRQLIASHGGRIAGYLARMLGSAAPIADLTQETFVRAYRALDRYDPRWSPVTWLLAIAANLARDHLRRAVLRHVEALATDAVQAAEGPAELAVAGEQRERVRSALASLPDGQREVVLLHVYEQLSYADVSKILGIPESTARSRMRYALAQLTKLLVPVRAGEVAL